MYVVEVHKIKDTDIYVWYQFLKIKFIYLSKKKKIKFIYKIRKW